MNSSGHRELELMLEKLRALPELASRAAPAVADAVRDQLEAQIASGTAPDGKAWQKTQDGKQPLQTADKALAVVAVGSTVFARLTGYIARHNNGTARGGIVRQILPNAGIPNDMSASIRQVLVEEFNKVMQGQ